MHVRGCALCMYVLTCVYVCLRACLCVLACVHMCVRVRMCVRVHVLEIFYIRPGKGNIHWPSSHIRGPTCICILRELIQGLYSY